MNWIHRLLQYRRERAAGPEARRWALQVLHFCNDGFQAAFLPVPGGAGRQPWSLTAALQIGVITKRFTF